jgi:hypothetical protein
VRTTEDAVRSLKRYLALVLGQGRSPLAAAKLYESPDAADLSSVVEDDVMFDHDDGGVLVTVGLASAAAASAAGLVRATTVGRRRFWVCPPGTAWSVSGGHTVDVDDPFAWSPGLVRGCVGVTASDWAVVLSADRWGTVLHLAAGSGRPYRCAMLAAVPELGEPGGFAVQTNEINVWRDAGMSEGITVSPEEAPIGGDLVVSRADFDRYAAFALTGPGLTTLDLGAGDGWARVHTLNVLAPAWTSEFSDLRTIYDGPGTADPVVGQWWTAAAESGTIANWPAALALVGAPLSGVFPNGVCVPFCPGYLPWDYRVGPLSPTADYGPNGYLADGTPTGPVPGPRTPVAADALLPADDWDVRFFHDEGEFEYPVCVVKSVGAPTLVSNQNWYELTQAYAVYAYPTPPPSATGTPSDAHVAAERVRQMLVDAFASARLDGARPMRIPLYDYDGLDANLPAAHREQADYMRVVGASVDLQPEPNDPRQTVVVADLRLNWRVPVGDEPGRGIVRSVELTTTET